MKKALRETQTLRAGSSKVRTPPARPLSQTHRQDRLQYTAPQCNNGYRYLATGKLDLDVSPPVRFIT